MTLKIKNRTFILFILFIFLHAHTALSKDSTPKRMKVIDFEGDLVEGLNRRPLDSVSEISERRGAKKRNHLYKKRRSFSTEVAETVRELRYQQ